MLKRVSIQNFKSLKDVTLNLQKVNLLIGPNNSGKTNFLKALEVNQLSGPQNLDVLEAIAFKHRHVGISYTFDYLPDPQGDMNREHGNLNDKIYTYNQKCERENNGGFWSMNAISSDWLSDRDGVKLDIEVLRGHRKEFFDFKTTKIFCPDPSKLVQQVKFSADQTYLLPDCSNLIGFYFYVDTNFKKLSKSIQDSLSDCIPEIMYFTTPPVKVGNESLLGLRFFNKDDTGYWAEEVSEGVLYFLSLLCIINQPNPPKLLLLEEPERGIHPRRIWEVMKFIFQLAEEKDVQIILTTHNEHVVNAFSSMPEAVFVFDKDEETGATTVRNLQKDIIEPSHQRSRETDTKEIDFTSNLGENWMYGLIGGVPADEL